MGVFESCKPRKDVLQGDLSDAIFAADFGDLIGGAAPNRGGEVRVGYNEVSSVMTIIDGYYGAASALDDDCSKALA